MNTQEIPYWKRQQIESEEKKKFAQKYPEAQKIVKRKNKGKWEYGVIVPSQDEQQYYIRFDNTKKDDREALYGLPFEYAPEYVLQHINLDGTLK